MTAFAAYMARPLGRLGDDPATIAQIIGAGYDPNAEGVTYTVDDAGNVMQNLTITASAPGSAAATQQARFPWPLVMVLALIGTSLYAAGKHS